MPKKPANCKAAVIKAKALIYRVLVSGKTAINTIATRGRNNMSESNAVKFMSDKFCMFIERSRNEHTKLWAKLGKII